MVEEGCSICGISVFTSDKHRLDHLNGKRHQSKEKNTVQNIDGCTHCNITSFQSMLDRNNHLKGRKHKWNIKLETLVPKVNKEFNDLEKLNSWLIEYDTSAIQNTGY
jgi:hypothetical protein